MFRTKDLLLFVSILLFLFTGISFTVIWNKLSANEESNDEIAFRANNTDIEATIGGDEFDHTTYINNLRAKLAAGEGRILEGPPVFESVDTAKEADAKDDKDDVATSDEFLKQRLPLKCSVSENADEILALWPSTGVSVAFLEGARVVTVSEKVTIETVTSTSVDTVTRTLIQLPVPQTRILESSCLASDVVGVTPLGALISNADAWKYTAISPTSLVGYARDGFPIYGALKNDTVLDECGGYNNGGGYGYHLRVDEDFILGCYAGTPVNFLIQ